MKNFWYFGGAAVAAIATFVACTSSSSGTPNNGANGSNCTYNLAEDLQLASGAGSACASCIQSNCGSQVSAYEATTGCGSYLTCICPNGTATTDSATIQACASQASQSGCESAANAFSTCADTNCQTQCKGNSSGSGGSGSSSGGGSGSSSGSSSGGSVVLTGACLTYVTCCVNEENAVYAALADAGEAIDAGDVTGTCTSTAQTLQQAGDEATCAASNAAEADAGIAGCQ